LHEPDSVTFIQLWKGRIAYPDSLDSFISKLEDAELIALIQTLTSTHENIYDFSREDRYSSLAWLNAQYGLRQHAKQTLKAKSKGLIKRIFQR